MKCSLPSLSTTVCPLWGDSNNCDSRVSAPWAGRWRMHTRLWTVPRLPRAVSFPPEKWRGRCLGLDRCSPTDPSNENPAVTTEFPIYTSTRATVWPRSCPHGIWPGIVYMQLSAISCSGASFERGWGAVAPPPRKKKKKKEKERKKREKRRKKKKEGNYG